MTNPTIDCLLDHRSIRKYRPKPVEQKTIDLIVKAGTRAATGGNLQLYSFVVIDDPAKKEQLDRLYPQMEFKYADIPLIIIALADLYRTKRWFQTAGVAANKIENNRIYNLMMANWDALIALQNMVVAAESLGLGTCYVGNVLMMDIGELLGAPEHVFPAGLVCMGYPDSDPELSSRLPLDAVVHKNEYHLPSDSDIRKFYQEREEVWDRLPDELKERLNAKGVHSIPQGIAARKFSATDYFISDEKGYIRSVTKASRTIASNLKKAGFNLTDLM